MKASRAGHPSLPSLFFLAFLAGWVLPGCTRYVEVDRGPQAYYQTGFPVYDTSDRLRTIMESVKPIRMNATYRTYEFTEEDAPDEGEALNDDRLGRASDTLEVDLSRRAAAVVVGASREKVVLMTANHAVHFPDTVVEHFASERTASGGRQDVRRIRSVSVLTRSTRWVTGLADLEFFEVLASDERRDLAFVGLEYPQDEQPGDLPILSVPEGEPDRLVWGSFVYVMGFPSGYPMVTRGIVSNPEEQYDAARSFLIDGVWNEGMSGGPVLAVRGEGNALEWVGMARAAAVTVEHQLAPAEGAEDEYEPWVPYEGPLYLEEARRILYGITLSISMDTIRRFVDEHRHEVEERGYELGRF